MVRLQCGKDVVSCRGIVFDKDGRIIDSMKIWPELIAIRVRRLQQKIGFSQEVAVLVKKVMGLDGNNEIIGRSVIVIGTREQTASAVNGILFLYHNVAWDLGLEAILESFKEADLELGLEYQALPIPGTKEMMRDLAASGLKIAVATNDSLERTKSLMECAGLAPFISAYACRDEVTEGKPSPDLMHLACERMGLEAEQCVMVGDSILDLKMALNAGKSVETIGVLTGASKTEDFVNYTQIVLPSVADIRPVGKNESESWND